MLVDCNSFLSLFISGECIPVRSLMAIMVERDFCYSVNRGGQILVQIFGGRELHVAFVVTNYHRA